MITDSNKRQASLNLLQRLRRQGLPSREEQMGSMFDGLLAKEEGEEDTSEYEMESAEEQEQGREKKKQKKGPQLEPGKVEKFKRGFMSVK